MIIDAHVHLYLGDTALDELIAACDGAGIDKVCLSAGGPSSCRLQARLFSRHPRRTPTSVGGLVPPERP